MQAGHLPQLHAEGEVITESPLRWAAKVISMEKKFCSEADCFHLKAEGPHCKCHAGTGRCMANCDYCKSYRAKHRLMGFDGQWIHLCDRCYAPKTESTALANGYISATGAMHRKQKARHISDCSHPALDSLPSVLSASGAGSGTMLLLFFVSAVGVPSSHVLYLVFAVLAAIAGFILKNAGG
jgi:hypothetical protein